jgi:hypothetical protein
VNAIFDSLINQKLHDMKHSVILSTLFLTLSFSAVAQKAGEKIQIESSGAWYDGQILKVEGDKYFVSFDGWSDSWDEWVGIERIRGFKTAAPAKPGVTGKFQVGDRVEVEYGMIPAPATVVEVGENKYHIQYDNKLYKSKWVTEREIKKL